MLRLNVKNNRSSRILSKIICTVLAFIICLSAFPGVVYANSTSTDSKENKEKVVKVGWTESIFSFSDINGRRDGYAYEYQCKIAAYSGWQIEYVEGTWTNLFHMLERGEIDVLNDVNKTPSRMDKMLFSDRAMGKEEYFILIKSDNTSISEEDYSTLNGKKVGIEADTVQTDIFLEWEEKNGVDAELVEKSFHVDEMVKMLENGELDAVVSSTSFNSYMVNCMPIAVLGTSDYYFAINKDRPDLKKDIDHAMEALFRQDRYYNEKLDEKYMTGAATTGYLPNAEKEWLNKHGKIKIGYDRLSVPFCSLNEKTGEIEGFIVDFMRMAKNCLKNAEVEFEPVPYDTTNDLIEALKRGEVDVVFPLRITSYDAEKNRILITDEIGRTELMAIIKEKNIKTFSISNSNYVAIKNNDINTRSTAESNFPTWKFRVFEDYDGCLNSVVDETADCILVSNYTKNLLDDTLSKEGLAADSTGISIGVTFGISSGSLELYSIMSRIINILSDTEINTALVEHSYAHNTVTFRDFLRDNFVTVLTIIGIVFLIIIMLLTQSILAASRERKAAKEAEAASYAKTSFLFNMSHDIRTPMNAIMGFRDLLEKNQEDPELRADYLKKIKESSQVLLSIINNVLEMARIEKGTITLNETAVSTEQLNDSLYSLFNEMMQRKNITFYRTIHCYHKYIYLDISKTREIFMNVLSNAYKYTEQGGVVRMDTTEIPSDKEGYANIKTVICDNGIGMDEEFLPDLFNEFTRERGVNTGKIEGTGLGMAIVKRLVDFLGGTVTVESKKGEGTTFTIILPHRIADKADLDLLISVEVDKEKFKGKTVLLAEDNDINAEIANEVLTDLGFEVERVEDGRLCVERFLDTPAKYDFILMDVQMPYMNGYEATKAIRDTEGFKTNRIPIIAMTANAFEEDRQAAFAAGMNGHVAKPIDVNELVKEIAKVLA